MRLKDDIRKTVVFLGYEVDDPEKGNFNCKGTGFLLGFERGSYLVTAAHVAKLLDPPFQVRLNTFHGGSENITADSDPGWYYHSDPNVDVAVVPLGLSYKKWEVLFVREDMLVTDKMISETNLVGIGDMAYVIGLFRLLHGRNRNIPIVHSGSIAMMACEEPLPQMDRVTGKRLLIKGHMVQANTLDGLSGAPVFVRPPVAVPRLRADGTVETNFGDAEGAIGGRNDVLLFGVWTGAWDAPPDQILAAEFMGKTVKVPVGYGIVVPVQNVIDILMRPDLVRLRYSAQWAKQQKEDDESAQPG